MTEPQFNQCVCGRWHQLVPAMGHGGIVFLGDNRELVRAKIMVQPPHECNDYALQGEPSRKFRVFRRVSR